jgi:hypothetical protein
MKKRKVLPDQYYERFFPRFGEDGVGYRQSSRRIRNLARRAYRRVSPKRRRQFTKAPITLGQKRRLRKHHDSRDQAAPEKTAKKKKAASAQRNSCKIIFVLNKYMEWDVFVDKIPKLVKENCSTCGQDYQRITTETNMLVTVCDETIQKLFHDKTAYPAGTVITMTVTRDK